MGLPSPHKPSRFISPLRARQLHRALKNLKLTLICGLLTVLVLRGALGAGKFGTPAKDYEEIKYQFERVHNLHSARKQASRVLTEVIEERHRPIEAIEAQAHSTSYVFSVDAKVQSNGRLQGKHELKESNLDVKVTIDPVKPYGLSPKVSDSDALRLQTNPNPVGNKPKIMLVTGYHPSACEDPKGNHYLLKFVKNKVDYCKLHDIEILYNSDMLDAELSGPSAKLCMLSRLMRVHPQVEWFWWMPSDALFTDMAFELPMENFISYNVVLLGWDNMPKTGVALTSGSFLIRNCDWSLNMLDALAGMHSKGQFPVEAGTKSLPGQPDPNSQPVSAHMLINEKRNWGEEVPLEKSTFLHGYREVPVKQSEEETAKNHESGGDESRPFVTRFAGHKICEKDAINSENTAALYVKYMERALDSADSQVLQLNSFQQKSSSLSALRRLRGGHDGILVSSLDVLPSTSDQFKHKSRSLS